MVIVNLELLYDFMIMSLYQRVRCHSFRVCLVQPRKGEVRDFNGGDGRGGEGRYSN
jgi:hypothetical protein